MFNLPLLLEIDALDEHGAVLYGTTPYFLQRLAQVELQRRILRQRAFRRASLSSSVSSS